MFGKRKPVSVPRIGLALGGGGAKGLCHISFLKIFDDLGIRPAVISGTSVGAIIGAFYASGMSARQIEKIFISLSLLNVTSMVDLSLKKAAAGLIKGNRITAFLRKHLGRVTFEELSIPLRVTATDFWRRSEVTIKSGDVVEAVRASASLPGILEPVLHEGRILIDGGAVNPLPYDLIRGEADIIVAVDVSGAKSPNRGMHVKPHVFESILSTFQIMMASIVEGKMSVSRPDIYIKPELKNIRVMEFYRAAAIMKGVEPDALKLKSDLLAIPGITSFVATETQRTQRKNT